MSQFYHNKQLQEIMIKMLKDYAEAANLEEQQFFEQLAEVMQIYHQELTCQSEELVSAQQKLIKAQILMSQTRDNFTGRIDDEKCLKIILENMDALIFVVDMHNHEILFSNEYGIKTFGDLIGQKCYEFIRGNDEPCEGVCGFCANIKSIVDDGNCTLKTNVGEFKNKRNSKWYSISYCTFRWIDSRMVKLAVVTDITERKQVEITLHDTKEKYQKIVDHTQSIIYNIDQNCTICFVSPSWKTLLGHEPEEVQGQDIRIFIHEEDLSTFEMFFHNTVETGVVQPAIEYRTKHKNGSIHWHRSVVVPFYEKNQQNLLFVGNTIDITEQKLAEFIIEQRIIFQKMVVDLSTEFLSGNEDNFDNIINHMLEQAGKFFQVDRTYLFEFSNDLQYMTNTYEWCAVGVTSEMHKAQNQEVNSMPWWKKKNAVGLLNKSITSK